MRVRDWQMRLPVRLGKDDIRRRPIGYRRLLSIDLENTYQKANSKISNASCARARFSALKS